MKYWAYIDILCHMALLGARRWKEETKTCLGQAKCKSYLSRGQAGIHAFWELCKGFWRVTHTVHVHNVANSNVHADLIIEKTLNLQ